MTLLTFDTEGDTKRNNTTIELNKLNEWLKSNKLTINPSKTKTMTYNKKRGILEPIVLDLVELEEVASFKLVGTFLDPNLNYKSHVKHVIKKLGLFTHLFARTKKNLPLKLKMLFFIF